MQRQGLTLVERNYRVAAGPRRRAGGVDLIVREREGTLVFDEVRRRASSSHDGAAASVVSTRQRSLVLAAQHQRMQFATPPACRFDVIAIDGDALECLKAAFDAD